MARMARENLDFDQTGPRDAPLLPLLHQNLLRLDIDDPLLGKFKGIHRRTWYKNQLKLSSIRDILRRWQADDISAICLPDISLAVHKYADIGMRPIKTRLLVPAADANQAIQSLKPCGWQPKNGSLPSNFAETNRGCTLTHKTHGPLYLRWHLFASATHKGTKNTVWDGKRTTQLLDVSTYALDPTDQLLHICLRGSSHRKLPLWVADALTLLRHEQTEIDWQRFDELCKRGPRLRRALSALTYLSDEFDAPIPPRF